jgi:hypothetical protein
MGKLYDTIKKLVEEESYVVGDHASERLEERGIMEWQAVAALLNGELIVEKPKSRPNPTIEVKERNRIQSSLVMVATEQCSEIGNSPFL